MIVTESVDTLLPRAASPPRGVGTHLSDVINVMAKRLLPGRTYDGWDDMSDDARADVLVRWEMGFLWEDVLSTAYRERHIGVVRPPEMLCDGILMNPDGVDAENGVVEEYKATWMSAGKPFEEKKRWIWQVSGYCWALGYTRAMFRVLYVNGDYTSHKPLVMRYDLEFGEAELRDTWMQIRRYAKIVEAAA